MKELQTKCQALKDEAKQLMLAGKLTKYLAKLTEIQQVQTQIAQLDMAA